MDVVSNNYMPGDPRLVDHIVYELKAQGIFDNFRKECIADVDTKPAYQNLRQRVEGSVIGFLKTQQWRPDMNKNQVREMLRKNISESGFLETGVERIVDQVVNPKINTIFLPQVENVVYKVLGIQKPSTFDELKSEKPQKSFITNERLNMSGNNLLPSDLEAVSPESEPQEKKLDVSNESQKLESSKMDEDESPPFEPLEELTSFMVQEDNSVDSHLSGFSGLASHDSNHSFEANNKLTPMEISNQDSQFSKQSSDDHLSIVMYDETESKIEINEDSTLSKISKTTDSNSKSFDFLQDNQVSSDRSSQSSFKQDKNDIVKKMEDKSQNDEKKAEKHRSSDKYKSRHDSKSESKDRKNEKEKKLDRDKKDHKSKYSSKDGKDRKDCKNKNESENKSDKEYKLEKDRDRTKNSSSKHSTSKDKSGRKDTTEMKTKERPKELDSKESKPRESDCKDSKSKESKVRDGKEKNESSKIRDDSKLRSESKSHNSTKSRSDSKLHLKHNGKNRGDSSDIDKNSSKSSKKDEKFSRKDDKHQSRSEKYSSSKKDEKRDKDKKDPKKDIKKIIKDDHYSLKGKNSNRRSTDRDSSDGHSGTHSSSSSFADSSTSSQLQKAAQESSAINSRSNSGDSGNSDQLEDCVVVSTETSSTSMQVNYSKTKQEQISSLQLPRVKLIKPKFASNIFEARRLMKIRKKLGKIEKQNQMELIKSGVALNSPINTSETDDGEPNSLLTYEIVSLSDEPDTSDSHDGLKRPNILKKSHTSNWNLDQAQFHRNKTSSPNYHRKNAAEIRERKAESEEENIAEVVEVSDSDDIVSTPLQNSVISKESWDAVEAKLLENVMKTEYDSYANLFDCFSESKLVSVVKLKSNEEEKKDEDCLGFSQKVSLETERYLEVVDMLTKQLEDDIMMKEKLMYEPYVLNKTPPVETEDAINKRLPKIAIVDVTSDNEIIISPRKVLKRHASDHPDVHNNNNKTNTRLEEDQLNKKLNYTVSKTKPNISSKAKKAKVVDSTVNHLDTFNLPLSPAESDKSFTTTSDKKNEKDDPKVKRNSIINRATNNSCNQRYSTDDLYKPRLQFSSSRRRFAKNQDTN